MKLCGDLMAKATVIPLWSISEKFEASLLPCRITVISKQFGGWVTNGMDKKYEPEKVLVHADAHQPIAGIKPFGCCFCGLHKIECSICPIWRANYRWSRFHNKDRVSGTGSRSNRS